ncbi:MAG: hypothetical protein ACRCSF_11260 [Mycobacteriaceae bacterium]
MTVKSLGNSNYEILNSRGKPVGQVANFKTRTASGVVVPSALEFTATGVKVTVTGDQGLNETVYASWSFAPGSSQAEVLLP